jgi:hypothetical protein
LATSTVCGCSVAFCSVCSTSVAGSLGAAADCTWFSPGAVATPAGAVAPSTSSTDMTSSPMLASGGGSRIKIANRAP